MTSSLFLYYIFVSHHLEYKYKKIPLSIKKLNRVEAAGIQARENASHGVEARDSVSDAAGD